MIILLISFLTPLALLKLSIVSCPPLPLSLLPFPFPDTAKKLYNIFKRIRLTSSSLRSLWQICLSHCLDLLHILNYSFSSNTFPSSWKHNLVLSIPKSCDPSSFFLLLPYSFPSPRFSLSYLNSFAFLNSMLLLLKTTSLNPMAFEVAIVLQLSCSIYPIPCYMVYSGTLTSLVALDFSKAFDSINHDLFLVKLRFYGLSLPALFLLQSFLTNSSLNEQVLVYNPSPIFSSSCRIPSGVPQGTILDPLLFNIFVVDLSSITLSSSIICMLTTLFCYIPSAQKVPLIHPC